MSDAAHVLIFPDPQTLAEAAADRLADLVRSSRRFTVALAGGDTPRRLYETLATSPWRDRVPWQQTHIFWGDERCVPADDPASNYHMTRQTLLDHVPLPSQNVHLIPGEQGPDRAAEAYAAHLHAFFGAPMPAFDLVLLGLGSDGHVAALFPGSDALRETRQPVVGVTARYQDRPARRVTLTLPAINAARHVWFLVTGDAKAEVIRRLFLENHDLPARHVRPAAGPPLWLLDTAAAHYLGE